MVIDNNKRKRCVDDVLDIVAEFNNRIECWQDEYECTLDLSWDYSSNKYRAVKVKEISKNLYYPKLDMKKITETLGEVMERGEE